MTIIRRNFARYLSISIAIVFSLCLLNACTTATKQSSLFNTNPTLLTKQYTPDEITTIEEGFKANPSQYSQGLGNLMLWKINAKNNTFGRQLAELPDLNDGIDISDVKVLKTIDEYIEDVNFPADFASKAKLEKRNLSEVITKVSDYHVKVSQYPIRVSDYLVLVRWSSEQENYSHGIITIIDPNNNLTLKEVNPKSFEEGDSIVNITAPFNVKTGNVMIRINSLTNKDDEDYIELKFSASNNHSLQVGSGGSYTLGDESKIVYLSSTNENTESDRLAEKSEIVRLSSTNENAKKYSKVEILVDLTLDGLKHDEYRYSPSLEAFYWFIKDGKFNPESFNEIYKGSFDFTKMVWGEMEGDRWDGFDEVTSRLNLPEWVDYYENEKFSYKWMGVRYGGYPSPKSIFVGGRTGSCHYYASFGKYCLQKANFEAWVLSYKWEQFLDGWDGHSITVYKDQDKVFVIDNGIPQEKGGPRGISGPFDLKESIQKYYPMRKVIEYIFMK